MKINDRFVSATREIISPDVKNRALPQLKLLQLSHIQISILKYLDKVKLLLEFIHHNISDISIHFPIVSKEHTAIDVSRFTRGNGSKFLAMTNKLNENFEVSEITLSASFDKTLTPGQLTPY